MKINFIALKKKFLEDGFITINNIFNKDLVDKLTDEITSCHDALKYFDNKNILRRVEKIYDKGKQLKILNDKILILLKNIFNEEFLIFKDKFNAKPPSGEGFFAHYDGVFHFLDENNNKKNGWYEYGDYFINVLIALDECNLKNGALEIAKAHKGNFNELLKNTKNDGTPALTKEIESNTSFDLQERIQPIDNEKNNDILVEFDGSQLTNDSFQFLQQLPEILQDSGEIGEMELDIFKITINSLETYEKELIKCKTS